MQDVNLKEIERNAYRSTFQDGLWDIVIGTMALGFAVIPLINDMMHSDFWSSFSWLPVNLAALAFLYLGKRYITIPRIGLIRSRPERRRRLTILTWINVVFLSLGVVAGAITAIGGEKVLFGIYPYLMGLMVLAIFSISAYLFNVQRFYFYGILLVLAPILGEIPLVRRWPLMVVHHGYPVTFGLAAAVILCSGVVLFTRFVHLMPIESGKEDSYGDR